MGYDYGGYRKKYEVDIKKDVYVDLDYKTNADWDFNIDIDKEVDKDIDIDVKVEQYVDVKGHYAEVEFLVEDVAEYGPDLEWSISNVADADQGVSQSSFSTYAPGYGPGAGEYSYETSDVMSLAAGKDTFSELIITYEAYDYGFVASGSAIAASDDYGY